MEPFSHFSFLWYSLLVIGPTILVVLLIKDWMAERQQHVTVCRDGKEAVKDIMKHKTFIRIVALLVMLTTQQALAAPAAPREAGKESRDRAAVTAAVQAERAAERRRADERTAAKGDEGRADRPAANRPKDPGLIF